MPAHAVEISATFKAEEAKAFPWADVEGTHSIEIQCLYDSRDFVFGDESIQYFEEGGDELSFDFEGLANNQIHITGEDWGYDYVSFDLVLEWTGSSFTVVSDNCESLM